MYDVRYENAAVLLVYVVSKMMEKIHELLALQSQSVVFIVGMFNDNYYYYYDHQSNVFSTFPASWNTVICGAVTSYNHSNVCAMNKNQSEIIITN